VTFDMGAVHTTFNPPFAKLYPDLLRNGTEENHILQGFSGATAKQAVSLPRLSLVFGRQVSLEPATLLLDQTGGASAWAAANLGFDLIQHASPLTINFRRMEIDFGEAR
jgi:hypothetical protein